MWNPCDSTLPNYINPTKMPRHLGITSSLSLPRICRQFRQRPYHDIRQDIWRLYPVNQSRQIVSHLSTNMLESWHLATALIPINSLAKRSDFILTSEGTENIAFLFLSRFPPQATSMTERSILQFKFVEVSPKSGPRIIVRWLTRGSAPTSELRCVVESFRTC